jgi:hypothetical protein
MLASNMFPLRKNFSNEKGNNFQGENQQLPLGRRGLSCPKKQLRPMNKKISLRTKGFSSRKKKQNGSTNHVPLNNNFLGEEGINFFWGTISKENGNKFPQIASSLGGSSS